MNLIKFDCFLIIMDLQSTIVENPSWLQYTKMELLLYLSTFLTSSEMEMTERWVSVIKGVLGYWLKKKHRLLDVRSCRKTAWLLYDFPVIQRITHTIITNEIQTIGPIFESKIRKGGDSMSPVPSERGRKVRGQTKKDVYNHILTKYKRLGPFSNPKSGLATCTWFLRVFFKARHREVSLPLKINGDSSKAYRVEIGQNSHPISTNFLNIIQKNFKFLWNFVKILKGIFI